MIRIIDRRGTGKSMRLILIAKERNATIVCAAPLIFKQKIEEYGLSGVAVISYEEYLRYHDAHKEYIIDELDGLLMAIGGSSIIGYTLTIGER